MHAGYPSGPSTARVKATIQAFLRARKHALQHGAASAGMLGAGIFSATASTNRRIVFVGAVIAARRRRLLAQAEADQHKDAHHGEHLHLHLQMGRWSH